MIRKLINKLKREKQLLQNTNKSNNLKEEYLIENNNENNNIVLSKENNYYKVEIKEPLEEENLKKETVIILGLIYRDFLASPEEREELQIKDAEELKRIEKEMQEQYDVENIFKKRKFNSNTSTNEVSTDLIVYKEPGFLKKFFRLIKGIFTKNKF